MTAANDVLSGFGYFGKQTLRRFGEDRKLADWAQAFHEASVTGAMDRYEQAIAGAAGMKTPACWTAGWEALIQFRKDLGDLKDEFEGIRFSREKAEFVAEVQERFASL